MWPESSLLWSLKSFMASYLELLRPLISSGSDSAKKILVSSDHTEFAEGLIRGQFPTMKQSI